MTLTAIAAELKKHRHICKVRQFSVIFITEYANESNDITKHV